MPGFLDLKTKHFGFKYDLQEGYDIRYENVEKAHQLRLKATTSKELLRVLRLGGGRAMIPLGAVLATGYLLKDHIKMPSAPIGLKSLIFETVIPMNAEDEFNEYVSSQLASDLNRLFPDIEKHMREDFGDDADEIDREVLEALKKMKVKEVYLYNDEEVQAAKEACARASEAKRPLPPKITKVEKHPDSPHSSVLVFHESVEGVDHYKAVATNIDNDLKVVKTISKGQVAVLRNLVPGQSYLISIRSVKDEVESAEELFQRPMTMPLHDPHPWRTATGTEADFQSPSLPREPGEGESLAGDDADEEKSGKEEDTIPLWKSDLHIELNKILWTQFPEKRMKMLLSKCYELGLVEAKDLKYVQTQEVSDELKGTIKLVETLKLMDYAKDQHGIYPRSEHQEEAQSGSGGVNMHFGSFHQQGGGKLTVSAGNTY